MDVRSSRAPGMELEWKIPEVWNAFERNRARAIRSFDPCMPCTVHVANGDNMIIQDATTCACGAE